MSLGGGGFVSSLPINNIIYQGSYSASLSAGITAISTNKVDYWRAGPLFIGCAELTTSAQSAGTGTLTASLPNGLVFDTAKMANGATTSNQAAACLGFGTFFIQGGGWKFVNPVFNGSTNVAFAENTQLMQADEMTTGDGLKYWLIGPINGWT